jgi:hypothetical protein
MLRSQNGVVSILDNGCSSDIAVFDEATIRAESTGLNPLYVTLVHNNIKSGSSKNGVHTCLWQGYFIRLYDFGGGLGVTGSLCFRFESPARSGKVRIRSIAALKNMATRKGLVDRIKNGEQDSRSDISRASSTLEELLLLPPVLELDA